ncbi:MAG TPA: gamma-glutamyl-gamma-aminobutyrate hydrolase family protein [Actinophytocola sp.]|uniref:gamma-glutamyl-gamma-aminobutyrate hydrolase family protein n=1 Tax=Actinophytocola sp. TaxID=1872138 RepID=UPI002DDCAF32|nr:gamma-glutamyl-gamma-aminobutyrate hydrolase family protein [Actinophytocola sp.]HEV2780629.1 gamma-glutamyl-gamma-aminobutyrate hydrolase family protein [Actinophytocola sp.]
MVFARSADRPVIGIGAHAGPVKIAIFDKHATFVPREFTDQLYDAGCAPVLLPPLPGIEHTVARLDGLLVLAGPDVDPASYSARPHPKLQRTDPQRDAFELALLDAAIDAGLPILAICRGMQLLNVARNGTLHQHLPDIVGHGDHLPGPELYTPMPVKLLPGSHLAKIFEGDTATVPCHHHQAIDRLGAGLTATAWAEDGTIEAIEATDHPFALGVQWHAEESPDNRPFQALADAARLVTSAR